MRELPANLHGEAFDEDGVGEMEWRNQTTFTILKSLQWMRFASSFDGVVVHDWSMQDGGRGAHRHIIGQKMMRGAPS